MGKTRDQGNLVTDGRPTLGTNEIGIGTDNPLASLDVRGNVFADNISVAGTITYGDVTSVDSIGIVTAKSGLHVTGGNVGILTDNPQAVLHISGDNVRHQGINPYIEFYQSDGTLSGYLQSRSNELRLNSVGNLPLTFGTNDTERFRITSSGLVGIGTDIPGYKLDVDGDINLTGILRVNGEEFESSNWVVTGSDIYRLSNVGIGLTNPDLKLHVNGVNALPSTSGSTPTGHLTLRSKANSASHGMFMGVSNASPWSSWIQAQDANNNSTTYPLLLNPNGGSIGIGIAVPDSLLHVNGSSTTVRAKIQSTGSNSYPGVRLTNDARSYDLQIDGATDAFRVYDATATTERFRISCTVI